MISTSSAVRRRAVLLLAGTAVAILSSAAPAFAEDTAPPKPTSTSSTPTKPAQSDLSNKLQIQLTESNNIFQ
jgi:hypothetical protein